MKIEFPTKDDLINWLKKTTSAVLLSISLIGGIHEVHVQSSSAKALTNIIQNNNNEYFPAGAYLVEYTQSNNEETDDPVYTNIAVAITLQARLAKSPGRTAGGLNPLIESLSGFEYTAKIQPNETGYIGRILIVMPESPGEIEELTKILEELSICYIFPNVDGTIDESNLKHGKGIWA